MHPQISVIVPVYNTEKYLDICIQSILNQQFIDFELILVDDGSPDRCPQMCDDWAKKDERVKVIHKKNTGAADARNTGVQTAKSQYIVFVDSDDWVEPEFLSTLYAGMASNSYDMVQCNFRRVYDDGTEYPFIFPPAVYDWDYIHGKLMPDMLNDRLTQMSSSRCNKLYKTELVKRAGELCDLLIKIEEDYLFNFAYLGICNSILCMDTPFLYHYRANKASITSGYKSRNKYEKRPYYENMNAIANHFGCREVPNVVEKTQRRWVYYIYECAISNWSRADKKKEIREIIGMLDRKMWFSAIKTYDTLAKRICLYLSYFGMIDLMLVMVNVVKKIKGIA